MEPREEDNQIGFIAQDIINTDIGSTFVYGEEGSMNYSPSGFTAVVAKALQEEIIEKDEKIIELETELKQLRRDYEKQQKLQQQSVEKIDVNNMKKIEQKD